LNDIKPDLVVIDYLQLLKPDSSQKEISIANIVNDNAYRMKALAEDVGTCVLCVSSTNRQSDRENAKPRMSDLAYAGEFAADVVLILERKYGAEAKTVLHLCKCRLLGTTGEKEMLWDWRNHKIIEMVEGEDGQPVAPIEPVKSPQDFLVDDNDDDDIDPPMPW